MKRKYKETALLAFSLALMCLVSCSGPKGDTGAAGGGDGAAVPPEALRAADSPGAESSSPETQAAPDAPLETSPAGEAAPKFSSALPAPRPVPVVALEPGGEETLRRPESGEAPRYPLDMVIGELGSGDAGSEAYEAACQTMNALLSKERREDALKNLGKTYSGEITELLAEIDPRLWRLGGGREEEDGSVSFLIRFIGREKALAGEIYFSLLDDTWRVDDILLEVFDGETVNRLEFPSYERFF